MPGNALGFPWPSPVAFYPSELSPPQQLYCVSFAFESRSVRLFTLGKPRMCKLAGALVDRPVQFTAALALSPLLAGMSACRAVLASEGCLADFYPGHPTSGLWSVVKSVAPVRHFCRSFARCSHGLCHSRACSSHPAVDVRPR